MTSTPDSISEICPTKAYQNAECRYFSAGVCRSCELLGIAGGLRVSKKLEKLNTTLAAHDITPLRMHPIVLPHHPWQSRHKVKMAISGNCNNPIIGLATLNKSSVDLVECCLTPQPISALLEYLREVIRLQRLTPYDITQRSGELKHIIVMTTSDHSQGIVRFVLRSSEAIPRIRKSVSDICNRFPWVKVISCNIQPLPAAILEGPDEIVVTETQVIREQFGEIPLYLAPQSFMQVTPQVAHALYTKAAAYIESAKPKLVLDLFCGVGGFSLHAARHAERVVGVELSSAAIECATVSAREMHLTNTEFHPHDVQEFLVRHSELRPDVIIANPPRRGLSAQLLAQLLRLQPRTILYSSCAPETFARDAQLLQSSYTLGELTPFDMFPMTLHCEVLGIFTNLA